MEKLTGSDYLTRPLIELRSHPDFSPKVYEIVAQLSALTTDQLEALEINNIMNKNGEN